MKNLNLIVAVGKNMEIGKDNKLLWHIPEDLKFFKEKTSGKTIIMGSNTFYSLPKLLPNRHHIVLTLDDYKFPDEVEVYYDFNTLLKALETRDEEMFIIGGAAIYSLFIDYVDSMYITEIDKEYDADKYFPNFDKNKWNRKVLSNNECDEVEYKHVLYTRKG